MKKTIKPAITAILLTIFISLSILYGVYAEDSRLARSAQSAETLYAKVTAEMEAIDAELTKMASEPISTFIPTPLINSQNWLDQFIRNPACQIPCWENISPNETKIDVATRIVSGIPGVRVISLEKNSIAWYFDDDSSNSGYIVANQEGVVLQIYLWARDGKAIYLKDIIEVYDTPVAVLEGSDCDYILSYRYVGMLLSTTDHSCSRKPANITPSTPIYRIILFSPENQEYTLNIFRFDMDEIMWDGYKIYDFSSHQTVCSIRG